MGKRASRKAQPMQPWCCGMCSIVPKTYYLMTANKAFPFVLKPQKVMGFQQLHEIVFPKNFSCVPMPRAGSNTMPSSWSPSTKDRPKLLGCWEVEQTSQVAENPWPPRKVRTFTSCAIAVLWPACNMQGVLVCSYRFERNSHWVNISYPNSSTCPMSVWSFTYNIGVLGSQNRFGTWK